MKSALIVIDMQRALFAQAPDDAEAVISRINFLAERARQDAAPVIWVQHVSKGKMEVGSEGWQLPVGLDAATGDVRINKTTPDSFLRTDLQDVLDSQGMTHLVVCGYASEFCIDTSVRRAAALGYAVTLAADAHTTHDKPHATGARIREHENATLPNITSFGAPIRAVRAVEIAFR